MNPRSMRRCRLPVRMKGWCDGSAVTHLAETQEVKPYKDAGKYRAGAPRVIRRNPDPLERSTLQKPALEPSAQ